MIFRRMYENLEEIEVANVKGGEERRMFGHSE
jgi:hypothetical protein